MHEIGQSATSLDVIEEFLQPLDSEAKQNREDEADLDNPYALTWRKNIEYFRIDGTIKANDSWRNCDTFNEKTVDSKAKLPQGQGEWELI